MGSCCVTAFPEDVTFTSHCSDTAKGTFPWKKPGVTLVGSSVEQQPPWRVMQTLTARSTILRFPLDFQPDSPLGMICGQLPQQGSGVLQSISASSGHSCEANVGMQHWNALWALILVSFVSVGQYAGALAVCGGGDCFLSPWQELIWLGWCLESQLSGAPSPCLCQRALLCWKEENL